MINKQLADQVERSETSMDKQKRIRDTHGPIVTVFSGLTKYLTIISVQYNWFKLARHPRFKEKAFDIKYQKSKPWWQDLGLLWLVILSVIGFTLVRIPQRWAHLVGGGIGSYVLFDLILYHIRVLWFDGLSPAVEGSGTQVWSNHRLLLVSLLSYVWSIVIFPILYQSFGNLEDVSSLDLFRLSFKTATTFDLKDEYGIVALFQIIVSLFYLAVVIATMASMSYSREEIASSKE